MFDRPIAIGLSPNTQADDYQLALTLLFKPKKWQEGEKIQLLENWFKNYFSVETAVSFNAGRSAQLAILHAFNIGSQDEVLVQAFTCVAVPNSVIWAGAQPVFVDIDKSFNLDVADAEKKITSKTKALIVQHTFGIPAQMDKITAFCKKHHLILIEDCAHALGATYRGKQVGTFGDAAFFSFGRDKIVSSVFGGMAIINSQHKTASERLLSFQKNLTFPTNIWTMQQLLHPIFFSIILPLYNVASVGKLILWLSQTVHLLSFPVYLPEKKAKQPALFPKKLSNVLAALALAQLQKLISFNNHRKRIAQEYFSRLAADSKLTFPEKNSGAIYLRFPVLTDYADEIRFRAKKMGVILGTWYNNVIDPKGVDYNAIHYIWGSCPNAEVAARKCLNLPTYPTFAQKQLTVLCDLIKG